MNFDFDKELINDKLYHVDIVTFSKMNRIDTKSLLRQCRNSILNSHYNKIDIIPSDILYSKFISNSKIKKYSISRVEYFSELIGVSLTKSNSNIQQFTGLELKELISKSVNNYNRYRTDADYVVGFIITTNGFFDESYNHEFILLIKRNHIGDIILDYTTILPNDDGDGIRLLDSSSDFKRTLICLYDSIYPNVLDKIGGIYDESKNTIRSVLSYPL